MSASGRGRKRVENDCYQTPGWAIRSILERLGPSTLALDPACGDGYILTELVNTGLHKQVVGFDIDPERAEQTTGFGGHMCVVRDALAASGWNEFGVPDLVVMNPPYALALEFVQRAINEVYQINGTVAALLRLNWLASKRRKEFHINHPSDVYVLSRRPSFTGGTHGKGATDATEYAWFVWGPGRGNRWFVL